MRRSLYIPEEVRNDILARVSEGVFATLEEFESAQEDEDVLTGHLGSKLTTRSRKIWVENGEIRGFWTWSLQYRKFRGRGPGATEKALGADGIFELSLESFGQKQVKSLLFQAKMADSGGAGLVEQCVRLSTWREAAVVFLYSPEGLKAVSIDETLKARGLIDESNGTPLDSFIGDVFVGCQIGDNDLRYMTTERQLLWQAISGETVSVRFALKHKIRVNVRAPSHLFSPHIDRQISPDEIHKYRMASNANEMLTVQYGSSENTPNKSLRALAKIYHPDMYANFSLDTRQTVNARLQEFNNALEEIHAGKIGQHARSYSGRGGAGSQPGPSDRGDGPPKKI